MNVQENTETEITNHTIECNKLYALNGDLGFLHQNLEMGEGISFVVFSWKNRNNDENVDSPNAQRI